MTRTLHGCYDHVSVSFVGTKNLDFPCQTIRNGKFLFREMNHLVSLEFGMRPPVITSKTIVQLTSLNMNDVTSTARVGKERYDTMSYCTTDILDKIKKLIR